jgi:hypothetical protein
MRTSEVFITLEANFLICNAEREESGERRGGRKHQQKTNKEASAKHKNINSNK